MLRQFIVLINKNVILSRCDECFKRYHFTCLEPPLNKNPKKRGYSWHCADCDPTVSLTIITRFLTLTGIEMKPSFRFNLPHFLWDIFNEVMTEGNSGRVNISDTSCHRHCGHPLLCYLLVTTRFTLTVIPFIFNLN